MIDAMSEGLRRRRHAPEEHAVATQTTPRVGGTTVAVRLAPNIYSWFIVSGSGECSGFLVRTIVFLFVVMQVWGGTSARMRVSCGRVPRPAPPPRRSRRQRETGEESLVTPKAAYGETLACSLSEEPDIGPKYAY